METEEQDWGKLPPDFKENWVKLLRSGDYLQTEGVLYNPDANEKKGGFCCIGIAGLVCGIPKEDMESFKLFDYFEEDAMELAKKYKLPEMLTQAEKTINNPLTLKLADWNDEGGTFLEIADWIEENL